MLGKQSKSKTDMETLKERMIALRSATDYRLPLKRYVMVMIDGRSFSKLIKNKYEKPFDDTFISMMNEVAIYVCKNVQGCKFAYVQSDEITFVLTDFEAEECSPFFDYRLTKILSIIPSMASGKFNQLVLSELNGKEEILNHKLAEFDCKAWSVNKIEDVYSYYLWRQIDCIRNSKQMAAQSYLPHRQLTNLNTDEQIKKLLDEKGINWNEYDDGKKYGRFIYKEKKNFYNAEIDKEYERNMWIAHNAFQLQGENGKSKFLELGVIPIRQN